MTASATLMFQEAAELGGLPRGRKPRAVITIARGSSDHVTAFARYLIETRLGILTSSLAPSISSVYEARLDLEGVVCLAVSQSGKSPDLIKSVETAKAAGAFVIALVNAPGSPLEALADRTIPLMAGPERSVAAPKSSILTSSAILQPVAEWSAAAGLADLPGQLAEAWRQDWSAAVEAFKPARNLFVVGRGLGFGLACEAALKFKETCGLDPDRPPHLNKVTSTL